MKYELTTTNEARTPDYVGTTTRLDDTQLQKIKENVKMHNAQVRKQSRQYGREIGRLRRVRIMGRGPRAVHARKEGLYPRAFDSYIPQDLAVKFDVYVGEDVNNQHELREELKTGLTSKQRVEVQRLKAKIFRLQWEGRQNLNGN